MPLFDYLCTKCMKKFTLLLGMVSEKEEEKCPKCGSASVTRLISRLARLRSEDDIVDSLADPSALGNLDNPRELHSWMKKVGREMGEDLGSDFDEIMDGVDEESGDDEAM